MSAAFLLTKAVIYCARWVIFGGPPSSRKRPDYREHARHTDWWAVPVEEEETLILAGNKRMARTCAKVLAIWDDADVSTVGDPRKPTREELATAGVSDAGGILSPPD